MKICQKCGENNQDSSKFCVKCGNVLETSNQNVQNMEPVVNNEQPVLQNTNVEQNNVVYTNKQQEDQYGNNQQRPVQTNSQLKKNEFNYLMYVLAVVLKPIKTIKEELNKIEDTKVAFILTLIVSAFATGVKLITTMVTVIFEKSYSWSGGTTTKINFENLKDINYIELIGKNFLLYAGIILAIAGVYFIGSLIIKKQTKFTRLLGMGAGAVVPFVVASTILSPILGKIYAPLGVIATVVGLVYTIVIVYEIMNKELALETNDYKVYFNLICLSILGSAGYYAMIKIMMGTVENGLNNFLDILG